MLANLNVTQVHLGNLPVVQRSAPGIQPPYSVKVLAAGMFCLVCLCVLFDRPLICFRVNRFDWLLHRTLGIAPIFV